MTGLPEEAVQGESSARKRPKFTRSRKGCYGCRKNKQKCDEGRPICWRCRNMSRTCVYPEQTAASSSNEDAVASVQAIQADPIKHDIAVVASEPLTASSSAVCCVTPQLDPILVSMEDVSPTFDYQHVATMLQYLSDPHSSTSIDLSPTFEPISTVFFNQDERDLMKHFLSFGPVNLCAIPQTHKPIPFFDLGYCLANPRGSSFTADSLHLSLLSIAAAHRSSLCLQRTRGDVPDFCVGYWGVDLLPASSVDMAKVAHFRTIGNQMSKASLELCRTALVCNGDPEGLSTGPTGVVLLTGIVCCIIARVNTGGTDWMDAYLVGLGVIEQCGGAWAMLDRARQKSPEAVERVRILLESMVIIDVCHGLASGAAPTLLTEPLQTWWFEFADVDVERGPDTVQLAYGLQRGILELANRVNAMVYEKAVLSAIPNSSLVTHHRQKTEELLLELAVWDISSTTDQHALQRVQLGNQIMINTLKVIINVELLGEPHDHPAVQDAANAALDLLAQPGGEAVQNLLIPKIIVGSVMTNAVGREKARKVLGAMRSDVYYAYDNEEGSRILEELFRLRTTGKSDPSWRELMKDVLLF